MFPEGPKVGATATNQWVVDARCILIFNVLNQWLDVPNSSDCWLSISGSGNDKSFVCRAKNRDDTRMPEPRNLLLGCKAGAITFLLTTVMGYNHDYYKHLKPNQWMSKSIMKV
jgi:hypothetical protein